MIRRVATDDLMTALDGAGVAYELLPHSHTESAAAEAEALGLSPADVAKTLVVATPDGYTRAVLPADCRVDMHKLRELLDVGKRTHLATEDDLRRHRERHVDGAVDQGPPEHRIVIGLDVVVETGELAGR